MYNSVDLFSGIGGISLALHGVATTIMYCEIDTTCHLIMEKLFQKDLLHRAPIHPNVCELGKADVTDRVDMVCLGSPCVGFSPTGLRQGFENSQSGLFYEAIRVIKELTPAFVFLENVPNVLKNMREVHVALDELGYDLRWTVMSAEAVGAPHVRKRWFCLGLLRGDERVADRALPLDYQLPHEPTWSHPPSERLCADSAQRKRRVGALGNSVVPSCVRAAFLHLWNAQLPEGGVPLPADYLSSGFSVGGAVYALPPPPVVVPVLLDLTFDPSLFKVSKPLSSTCKQETIMQEVVERKRWATPRHGMVSACNVLTLRSIRDLPTLARFESGTMGDRGGQIAPQFVESMMGYPRNWTDYDAPATAERGVAKRKRAVKRETTVRVRKTTTETTIIVKKPEEDLSRDTELLEYLLAAPRLSRALEAHIADIRNQIDNASAATD